MSKRSQQRHYPIWQPAKQVTDHHGDHHEEHTLLPFTTHHRIDPAHLCDSLKESAVAVDDHDKRENKAEDKQTDNVRHVVGSPRGPVDAAGGAGTLRTVAAPSEQWWKSPNHGINPGESNAYDHFSVVGGVGLCGAHHGAVTLV